MRNLIKFINTMTPNALLVTLIIVWMSQVESNSNINTTLDSNGYIIYCPCMGRFGNQAEQFLGTFQFAKSLNRTLILPPFIEYVNYKVNFIPFEEVIDMEALKQYHRVISVKQFLSEIAPLVWPKDERKISCYMARNFQNNRGIKDDCNPFEGSPFREFWHYLGLTEFAGGSLFYKPLLTDYLQAQDWMEKFGHIPVLAFVGAPSSFPTNSQAVKLQKYVHFTRDVILKGADYREHRGFLYKPYLAIHLRHGADWAKACDLIHTNGDLKQLFSSQQCLGENRANSNITFDLCLPSVERIASDIQETVSRYNARHVDNQIWHVYIATDFNNESLWLDLRSRLKGGLTLLTPSLTLTPEGTFSEHTLPHFFTDLYLSSFANAFIGNCISSFSAFISRLRIYNLHFFETTHFFAFHKPNSVHLRDEL